MAGTGGRSAATVELDRQLQEKPYAFGFFSALRRLECAHPEGPRVGHAVRAAREPVRLGQEPSLAFAPSTLASYQPGTGPRPPRLAVFFLGLFGPNGPLPLHLTEYARDRVRNQDDPTFARFADLFHHRILSLFYRVWAAAQPTVEFDRPDSSRFNLYLGALCGMGQPALRNRDRLPDLARFHYAGLLGAQTRNAAGLEALLRGFFGMPVRLRQFVGQWIELPDSSCCRLGASPETGTLGQTAIAGSRVWDCQQKFRIVFGPLDLEDYRRLLPGSDSLQRLVSLVRNYVGDELDWDVNVILKKEAVPPLRLGHSAQLGLTSWAAS
ncbi:MAG TPA: type VI secretion system baseplate subunit TssG, partial [Deferrisomatales bacterium]|nr:type VI secretion system baseplate subunit TssG [Deferrisomatales bacterium]